ncbi:MAG: hypothetical protein ACLFT2_07035 [Candidatus Brocadiia bacterium]
MSDTQQQKSYVFTAAESKRLIARGVKSYLDERKVLNEGIVAVAKGTTNSYVVEELLGESIEKTHYCTGTTQPPEGGSEADIGNKLDDLVLRDGERWDGVSATDSVEEMGAGDVFVKGANALNYDREQAGILIGHPTGGTIGAAIGSVIARRATLLIPVGLEKSIPGDLDEVAGALNRARADGSGPALWPVGGEIFTELEALNLLSGVTAWPIGAGGILGAEGSTRIAVWGSPGQIEQADRNVEQIRGEQPFGS